MVLRFIINCFKWIRFYGKFYDKKIWKTVYGLIFCRT